MAIWDGIRRAFGYADRSPMPYQPSSMTFQDLDVDAIRENLRLETRGKRRGETNEPRSESSGFDEVERDILDLIQNEHKKSIEQYLGNIRAFAARLGHLDLERTVVEIRNEAEKAVTDFNIRAMGGLDFLETLKIELKEAKNDLNNFQQEHNRKRSASTKSMLWIVVSILFMLILFSGEIYFNGEMLGQGLISGLSQGIAYAMGFSAINIILGAIAGHFGFRCKNHERTSVWISGWLLILAWLIAIVVFNLGVGHFRDALSGGDWENARTIAIQSMSQHPFMLASLESYALWGFGILISLLFALDVYAMDDPYPGYGNLMRAYKKAVQHFIDGKDDIREDLEGWRDDAVKKMETSREQAGRWRSDYGTILSGISTIGQALAIHNGHLESVANRLLEYYRGENARARTTPPPVRFSSPFVLNNPNAPSVPTPKVLTEDEVTRLVQEATTVLQEAVVKLNAEYQSHMGRFATITEVLATGT